MTNVFISGDIAKSCKGYTPRQTPRKLELSEWEGLTVIDSISVTTATIAYWALYVYRASICHTSSFRAVVACLSLPAMGASHFVGRKVSDLPGSALSLKSTYSAIPRFRCLSDSAIRLEHSCEGLIKETFQTRRRLDVVLKALDEHVDRAAA